MRQKITLITLILSTSCFSQIPKNNPQKNLKSDLISENLKGPVSSYHLTAKYLDLENKYNNLNRIATPKGGSGENVFVEYNKYGLMTQSLYGIFSDSLVLEPMGAEDLTVYAYSEYDLIYKNKSVNREDYPSMLSQEFYHIYPNRSKYYKNNPALPSVVHEIYGMNYDDNKKCITDRVVYRTITRNKKLEGNENEDLDDKNLINRWHYEYSLSGLLRKISLQRDSKLWDFNIKYFNFQVNTLKAEIVFEYDQQERLIKYTVFDNSNNKKEEIGFVQYSYNPKYGYAETESIFKKYPYEYYLSTVHNYTRKYNKQGDLIADLLHVDPKDEELVREKQLFLDKYYEYKYDEHDNWIECKIRVNDPASEISAIMERKIEYFAD